MAEEARFLSEREADALRDIVRWWRSNARRSTAGRARTEEGDQLWTPETYIALTPPSGIPALSTETGTGSPDVLGSAECEVFRVEADGKLTSYGRRQLVYNISESRLPGSTHIVVTRHKDRAWLAVTDLPAVYIAKAPEGGLPAATNMCETGTGTGPIGLVQPVECDVYKLVGYRVERVEGLTKSVYNLGPDDIDECKFFRITRDAYGNWLADWWPGVGSTAEDEEDDPCTYAHYCINNDAYSVCLRDAEAEILGISTECCTDGQAGTGTAPCASSEFTFCSTVTISSGGQDFCFDEPIQEIADDWCICLGDRVDTFDCGAGVVGQRWVGSNALGTATLTKCYGLWCMQIEWNERYRPYLADYFRCEQATNTLGCDIDEGTNDVFPLVVKQTSTGLTVTLTTQLRAEACDNWQCWVNNSTLVSDCFTSDPGGSTLVDDQFYEAGTDCRLACAAFSCWQTNGLQVGESDYRFCQEGDPGAGFTLVSGPYLTEEICTAACESYVCSEGFFCEDEDCSVGCTSQTPQSMFCTNDSSGERVYGSEDCVILQTGPGYEYFELLATYDTFEECALNCVEE